ncbi:PREDICTED: MDS1 and EVI1 complex locus protein EVI1-A-like [Branchiostoma belcheri]|uniref:MDS1 and EVI1 complex locus protein EVI1-A-like n=1 Tax=Branchiostoma belcheri TaxID=7741 RepID=A0A6P4XJV8_BRABE|nr:PREDICTED: MDS1 and EVI1 complex locus protein EVI1-A-like [Branchiostoma belcheri]
MTWKVSWYISCAHKPRLISPLPKKEKGSMSFVCEICDKEFARQFNLDRHQERKHRDESAVASGEVVVDSETGSYRKRDVFDDNSDISYEHDTDALDSSSDEEDEEDEEPTVSQDEVTVSDEDESVVDSEEAESVTETDSDESDSESDADSDVSSNTASYDESEEYGYDSGDEEEWTLYRDWSIPLKHEPGDVPQRVIKETKRAGKKFYLVEFAAMPRYGYNIEYSKNWVPEQKLMTKYGYLVLK